MSIPRKLKTNFSAGELSPALAARVDLEAYSRGLKTAKNVIIHPHGGLSNRAGFEFISYARQDVLTVEVPFIADVATNETYVLLFSPLRINFTRNGVPLYNTALSGISVSNNGGDALFSKASHGYVDGDYVLWEDAATLSLHQRTFEVDYVSSSTFYLLDMAGVRLPFAGVSGTFTLSSRYTVVTPYAEADLRAITYGQDNDIMFLAHENHPPQELARFGDTNWTLTAMDFTPDALPPTGIAGTATTGPGYDPGLATEASYVVATISTSTGEESLPSTSVELTNDLTIAGGSNEITWTAATDANRYAIYKDAGGIYGFIGATRKLSFVDNNINEDTADGPQEAFNPFSGVGEYPRAVTLHEQRLALASSINDPQAVYLSKSTVLKNFGAASPAKEDDGIAFRVRAKERQTIQALVSTASGLAMFSSATEWMVTGGVDDYLTPTNTVLRPQSRRGSYFLQPLLVGDIIMYAQARGAVIRDFLYSFENAAYTGEDRTLMSRHLFDKFSIVSWCFAQSPYSIVWAVRDDGVLLSMTFIREHNIWGWTRHETDGVVESVTSVPEGDEDAVYITVNRTIDGVDYKFHERLASRRITNDFSDWFFVDSGLRYNGVPVSTVNGLHHLNTKEVAILADGFELPTQVVVDGQIDLGRAYSDIHIGLPYTSEIETLELDIGDAEGLGTTLGRTISIPQVVIKVFETRGIWIGSSVTDMTEWKQRQSEDWGASILPFTGTIEQTLTPEYSVGADFVIQQRGPLPMTILSVAPDVAIGG